ncbi:hypothetical protein D1872_252640 [compost metagenome]
MHLEIPYRKGIELQQILYHMLQAIRLMATNIQELLRLLTADDILLHSLNQAANGRDRSLQLMSNASQQLCSHQLHLLQALRHLLKCIH